MADFINDLKDDIISSLPNVSMDWAEYNAIITLATGLPKAQVVEKEKSLNLNLIMLMIGPSGIKKSLPLFAFTYRIIKKLEIEMEMKLLLPNRSSVPGFIKYVTGEMDHDTNKKEGKSKEKDVLVPHNEGIIIRDEFSGMFNQMRKEGWQSDGMEFVSEMYDGDFQIRATTTHGLNDIDDLYVCLISASTYHFITEMDPQFFIQGTGNRFLWCHYSAKDYKVADIDPEDYFKEEWAELRTDKITVFAKQLEKLYKKKLKNLYVDSDAGKMWAKYHKKCETEWMKKSIDDPMGWDYHPIKRYPELALKLSGIYAVSRQIDRIPSMPPDHLSNFSVIKEDMDRAINLVERNRVHFKEIVSIKRRNVPSDKPKSQIEIARSMLPPLASSKYQMLSAGEWLDQVETVTNNNTKQELKTMCLNRGWVKIVVPTPEVRTQLGVTSNNIQICKYVKGL